MPDSNGILVSNAPPVEAVPETWLGIPLRNKKKDDLVKKVMILSAIAALVEIGLFIYEKNENENFEGGSQAAVNLIIALSIPLCGYKGAQTDDKTMICWFCGCNFAEASWSVMLVFWISHHVTVIDFVCGLCEDNIGMSYEELIAIDPMTSANATDAMMEFSSCLQDTSGVRFEPSQCSEKSIEALLELKSNIFSTLIPLSIFQFLTFFYGNQLYRIDEKVFVDVPEIREPNNNTMIVAQTSFLPGNLGSTSGGMSSPLGGSGISYNTVAEGFSNSNSQGGGGDIELALFPPNLANDGLGPRIGGDNGTAPNSTAPPTYKIEGTYADLASAGVAQPVEVDFSNQEFMNSLHENHYTTDFLIQPSSPAQSNSATGGRQDNRTGNL